MASFIFRPFQKTYARLHRYAMESPTAYWSIVIGCAGPVMLAVVPPVRRNLGYFPPPPVPKTYPLPDRPRDPNLTGYDD
ncbi:hypothetical protein BT69DRAFT_1188155, partial [Atractiella rhizophila]